MVFDLGINLSIVFKFESDPVALFLQYQKLDSSNENGHVTGQARINDLVLTNDIVSQVHKTLVEWIGAIISVQKINIKETPDLPLELTVTETPTGISYLIEMGNLDQLITFDSVAKTCTLHASQTFTISFEAFMYFTETIGDLLAKIDQG